MSERSKTGIKEDSDTPLCMPWIMIFSLFFSSRLWLCVCVCVCVCVCARVCVFLAVHLLGLTWHLRHGESQLYENGLSSADHQQEDRSKTRPTSSIHLLDTLNPENTHAGDRGELTPAAHTIITDVRHSTNDGICLSVTTKQAYYGNLLFFR